LLAYASFGLRNDLATLKQLVYKHEGNYCKSQLEGFQLRFVSDSEYVIEPVCGVPAEAEIIKTNSLPWGVKRIWGSGVLAGWTDGIPDLKDAWVHLGYGDSQAVVGLIEGVPKVEWQVEDFGIGGDSPAQARCAEWGFSCCQTGAEVGQLARVRTVDCVNNCYQRCNKVPMVMYFNTDPMMNSRGRVLELEKIDPMVWFGYQVSDDEDGMQVEVDFGDGKKSGPLPMEMVDLEHEYQCRSEVCVYQVVLSGVDKTGVPLMESELNRLQVVVR
jgi:hypothetical protein